MKNDDENLKTDAHEGYFVKIIVKSSCEYQLQAILIIPGRHFGTHYYYITQHEKRSTHEKMQYLRAQISYLAGMHVCVRMHVRTYVQQVGEIYPVRACLYNTGKTSKF